MFEMLWEWVVKRRWKMAPRPPAGQYPAATLWRGSLHSGPWGYVLFPVPPGVQPGGGHGDGDEDASYCFNTAKFTCVVL